MTEYRHEFKYFISDADILIIRNRLDTVMHRDIHQNGDCYNIRSIYFDDPFLSGKQENEDGIDERRRYRIRAYDKDRSFISLERKEKSHSLTKKKSVRINEQIYEDLLNGNATSAIPEDFYYEFHVRPLRPVKLIEYERTAYIENAGNVRITFDRNIGYSDNISGMFDNDTGMCPVLPGGIHVLEVKYDEFLPEYIADMLGTAKLRRTAFSKYYMSFEGGYNL